MFINGLQVDGVALEPGLLAALFKFYRLDSTWPVKSRRLRSDELGSFLSVFLAEKPVERDVLELRVSVIVLPVSECKLCGLRNGVEVIS